MTKFWGDFRRSAIANFLVFFPQREQVLRKSAFSLSVGLVFVIDRAQLSARVPEISPFFPTVLVKSG
ncbi:hypothetical protein CKA32_002128 [Geitlerinema sp. FC II]|nr:hypothetical protein CKA32_002128 [Geitlerinema sp. FC II]